MKRLPLKIEKGMLIGHSGWWYVVVEAVWDAKDGLCFHCICDNANNIYAVVAKEVDTFLTVKEVGGMGWGTPDDVDAPYRDREIPYDIVVEVLSGKHDDRFDHWKSPIRGTR